MNTLKDAFDKAYIKKLSEILELYTRSTLFTPLRYRVAFAIYMIVTPRLHDKGIKEARDILGGGKIYRRFRYWQKRWYTGSYWRLKWSDIKK